MVRRSKLPVETFKGTSTSGWLLVTQVSDTKEVKPRGVTTVQDRGIGSRSMTRSSSLKDKDLDLASSKLAVTLI